jgi:hypothetical protein
MTLVATREKKSPKTYRKTRRGWSGEVVALCPRCKVIQTLLFEKDNLVPNRKFTQERDGVYHDCGSHQPCRLYRFY